MSESAYVIQPLDSHHDRAAFSCGVEALDRYLRQQAGQDRRKGMAQTFVLVERATGAIVGYYTLSAYGVEPQELPETITRALPRYPRLPAILLGRLAIDRRFRGQGFGADLLYKALRQVLTLSAQLGALGVIVEAKDDNARDFYAYHGFIALPDTPQRLFMPLRTIAQLP